MKFKWFVIALTVALVGPVSFAVQDDAARPLPPLKTVLERVAEQAQKEEDIERTFKQHYSYDRNRVTEYRDAKGEVKKREEKKRSYKPTAAPVVPAVQSSEAKPQKQKSTTDEQFNPRGKSFEKGDFAPTDDLLGRFDFTLVKRQDIEGRPALVLDFKPANKRVPERNIKDKFINKAAGRVWVDEEDYALVKADLHLTERVNVIGGLVGAVWKFTYKFERERTVDGLWYARTVNWHLEGREVFVNRTVDYHEERTDVKKVWQFNSAAK